MKKIKSYKKLSEVYDEGWSEFSSWTFEFTQRLFKKYNLKNVKILELACGTGIFAIEMAKNGSTIVGLDKSEEMINLANKKAEEIDNCNFQIADMTDFSLKNSFDICTCWFDSVNYLLTPESVKSMFSSVSNILNHDGLFVFDSDTHNHYISNHYGSFDRKFGKMTIHHDCRYESNSKLAYTDFIFPDNSIEEHIQRPYDLNDLEPLLSKTGFKILETMRNFKGETYNKESNRLICVTQKKE